MYHSSWHTCVSLVAESTQYAVFLEEKKKSAAEAEHYYLITLENDPTNNHCLQRYGDFLESQGLDCG